MTFDFQLCPECGDNLLHDNGDSFYVSVYDAGRHSLLAGPFSTHAAALEYLEPAKAVAYKVDHKAWFYAFGTCRVPGTFTKPGLLNKHLGL